MGQHLLFSELLVLLDTHSSDSFGGNVAICGHFSVVAAGALNAVKRERDKDGPREGKGLWHTAPISPPENYEAHLGKPLVLVVANHKGGVGKTTLTANLGAYWAQDWNKRVAQQCRIMVLNSVRESYKVQWQFPCCRFLGESALSNAVRHWYYGATHQDRGLCRFTTALQRMGVTGRFSSPRIPLSLEIK